MAMTINTAVAELTTAVAELTILKYSANRPSTSGSQCSINLALHQSDVTLFLNPCSQVFPCWRCLYFFPLSRESLCSQTSFSPD